jgi:putative flippase GtrA
METCYKVFRREVIQSVEIKEDRFGFEPEIVAKIAHMRLRIYEMGISYFGRTYEEGKKIGFKDGLRALYCIVRYNAHRAPWPIQFLLYLFIGGFAAVVNFLVFLGMFAAGMNVTLAAGSAFAIAAVINYILCVVTLFRHEAKWNSALELFMFLLVVGIAGTVDVATTKGLLAMGFSPALSKIIATGVALILNFAGRRFLVFPEPASGPWKPQVKPDK